jgi:transcriptional regulator with XRE-family HTH domain
MELKRYRTEKEETQREVADALYWSQSKIIRIENGSVGVGVTDLKALLHHFGVTDEAVVDELVELAKESKQQPWQKYRDILSNEFIRYLGYVSAASEIRQYQTILVPGMLQIEEYTRALMVGAFGRTEDQAETYVEFRQEYREILTQAHAPTVSFVLDEAVIRRAVGGPGVMAAQLENLRQVAKLPNVEIRIVPFGRGAHPGMRGPFTHLAFPDPILDDIVHMENPLGDSFFRDDPDVSEQYLAKHWELERIACTPAQLGGFLDRAIERFPRDESEAHGEEPPTPQ